MFHVMIVIVINLVVSYHFGLLAKLGDTPGTSQDIKNTNAIYKPIWGYSLPYVSSFRTSETEKSPYLPTPEPSSTSSIIYLD